MRYMVDRTQLVVAIRYLHSLPQRNRCEIKKLVENYKKHKKITAVRTNLHSTAFFDFPFHYTETFPSPKRASFVEVSC